MSSPNVWRILAASVQGSSHAAGGMPCQDAHHWTRIREDILVVAIADGASSARFASQGAALASSTAVAEISARLLDAEVLDDEAWKRLFVDTFERAKSAIEMETKDKGAKIRDFATTLIVAVASSKYLAVGQVGDGGVVYSDNSGQFQTLSAPQIGEYANETVFLTGFELSSLYTRIVRADVTHLAVFSDGLQRLALKFPAAIPHAPFFEPLFVFLRKHPNPDFASTELAQFLSTPRILDRTDDDVTLFLAARTEVLPDAGPPSL